MKTINIRAGHTKRIAYFSDGNGEVVEFRAEAEGGGPPAGQIEVKKKGTLGFGFNSEMQPLKSENSLKIGRLSHQVSISVMPESDTVITITKGVASLGQKIRIVVLVAALAGLGLLGAFIASEMGLLPPPPAPQPTSEVAQ